MKTDDDTGPEEQGPDLFGGPDATGRLFSPEEAARYVGVPDARFKQLVPQHGIARREVANHEPQWVFAELDLQPLKRWLEQQEPQGQEVKPEAGEPATA
jgi:hypothetical protein